MTCVLIVQNLISVIYRVFFKLTKVYFEFCLSVTSVHLVSNAVLENTASAFLFSKLNWDALK